MRRPNSFQKLIILGLTLLAFFLRAYRLDFQSIWIEEAWTLYYTHLPVGELWPVLQTGDPKPPFYYFTMLYWLKWLGDSEYALRFYSLLFGVMAVPLTYRLGQALSGDRLGLLTALLMTVAPYQIWHSQEARMYSILTAASVMSMGGFVRLWQDLKGFQKPLRSDSWREWLIYVVGTLWALMTHYHAVVLIGIQGLFLLLTWRRHWRTYLAWAGTLIIIFLLYLPWLIFGSSRVQEFLHWIPQPTLGESYLRSAVAYAVGEYMPHAEAIPLALVFITFYGLGLIYAARRQWGQWRGSEMLAFLVSYTLAPILAAWTYGELRTPVYLERYLIPVQVGFLLTVAIGLLGILDFRFRLHAPSRILDFRFPTWNLQHHKKKISSLLLRSRTKPPVGAAPLLLATLLLATLLSINGYALWQHYFNPAYAKDDWRAVARTIENFSLPGDAIVLTGDGGEKAFSYYYHGNLPLYLDFLTPVPPEDRASQIIAKIAATHGRIWYTPYGVDIDATLERWLAENAYPAWHNWLGRKRLALYDSSAAMTDRLENVNTTFTNSARQGPTLVKVALPHYTIAAGDLLPLVLTWQTATPLESDYRLSLRLVNGHGDVFAQSDWPPLAAVDSTSTWPANQAINDRRSLWLPPDIPPGNYALQLVVYDPASSQTLGQPLIIPNIAVAPAQITPPLTALPIPNPISQSPISNYQLPITLLGYILPDKIQPGQEMWLWLYWQSSPAFSSPSFKGGGWGEVIRVSLNDGENTMSTDFSLVESVGLLDSWGPGQVRRAVYHVPTSPRLTGNQAQVRVALLTPTGQVQVENSLGQLSLMTRSRQFEIPSLANTTGVAFGNSTQLKLIGHDLPLTQLAPGDSLKVTLYWQAEAEMDTDYTVFVQLLDSTGQVVAQVDLPPLAGAAPTTTWLPGEILTDPYTLTLPTDLPPGDYRLITGLYHAATGERLPLASGGNFVELSAITVK